MYYASFHFGIHLKLYWMKKEGAYGYHWNCKTEVSKFWHKSKLWCTVLNGCKFEGDQRKETDPLSTCKSEVKRKISLKCRSKGLTINDLGGGWRKNRKWVYFFHGNAFWELFFLVEGLLRFSLKLNLVIPPPKKKGWWNFVTPPPIL